MMFEFEATNNNCQFPCLIVHDDGEEEKVDFPDDTVKQCFYLILKIIIALFQCPQGAILDTHTSHHDGMMPRLPPVGCGRLQA
jgi:hypothetical protein